MATRDLANAIDKGYVNKNKFTPSQLSAIYKRESKIPNFYLASSSRYRKNAIS